MSEEPWTPEKNKLRLQLNREYARFKREQKNLETIGKPRQRKFGPKKYKGNSTVSAQSTVGKEHMERK